ncbi:hypothetical protein QVD17_30154 [Tagetes erecta]|uniref:RRM domain-containing protein n=1 Tax=Tagetes erecta TaxID=13708 RepID=A0AAD8K108_TARER|nr:hypothetical protein QVD17_30154 [Tagetes erecta]
MRGSRERDTEGWQVPNYRRRSKKKEILTTFYVSNIPEGLSHYQLREAFFPFGKIRDAFIPKKKDSSGGLFAFVRYADVFNPKELEEKLYQIMFGNRAGGEIISNNVW